MYCGKKALVTSRCNLHFVCKSGLSESVDPLIYLFTVPCCAIHLYLCYFVTRDSFVRPPDTSLADKSVAFLNLSVYILFCFYPI